SKPAQPGAATTFSNSATSGLCYANPAAHCERPGLHRKRLIRLEAKFDFEVDIVVDAHDAGDLRRLEAERLEFEIRIGAACDDAGVVVDRGDSLPGDRRCFPVNGHVAG